MKKYRTYKKANSSRPKTGYKQVFNNNITNVDINFLILI